MTVRAAILLVTATLLQVTLLGRVGAAAPNLVLAVCAARAWTAGGRPGMTWAIPGGLLLDLAGGAGPLGVHVLALLAATYAAGALAAAFDSAAWPLTALAGAVASIVYGTVVVGAADSLGLADVGLAGAVPLIGLSALTGAPAAVVAVAALRRWPAPREQAPQW